MEESEVEGTEGDSVQFGSRRTPPCGSDATPGHVAATTVTDIAVIGGGIIGVATARALTHNGARDVLVLEAEDRLASHQTGHNSGVVHSGLYYQPGSIKAHTCTEGREAMYRYCRERGLPHRRCGKLVVATSEDELPRLDELEKRGLENGLDGICRLDAAEVAERAPEVRAAQALWVPHTGVTDFSAVTRSLAQDVIERGGRIQTGARLTDVRREDGGLRLRTTAGIVEAGHLINCAGLQSDRVARMCDIDPGLRIVPFRGDYFRVADPDPALASFPVYPVPDPRLPFLGVHFTPDLDGRVEAGPNASLAFSREGYDLLDVDLRDMMDVVTWIGFWRVIGRFWRQALAEAARSLSRRAFARAARTLVPGLDASDFSRSGSGVRAQAVEADGTLVDDFRIVEGDRSLHVVNAPSPAATASLAIGKRVAQRLLDG